MTGEAPDGSGRMTCPSRSHHLGTAWGRCLAVSRCRTIRFSSESGDNWKGPRHREHQSECRIAPPWGRETSRNPRNLPGDPRRDDRAARQVGSWPGFMVLRRQAGWWRVAGEGHLPESLHGGDWEDGRANWRGSGQPPPVPNPPNPPNPPTPVPDFPARLARRKFSWCKMWHPTCTMAPSSHRLPDARQKPTNPRATR